MLRIGDQVFGTYELDDMVIEAALKLPSAVDAVLPVPPGKGMDIIISDPALERYSQAAAARGEGGDNAQAETLFREAIVLSKQEENWQGVAQLVFELARDYLIPQRRYGEAETLLNETLTLCAREHESILFGQCCGALAQSKFNQLYEGLMQPHSDPAALDLLAWEARDYMRKNVYFRGWDGVFDADAYKASQGEYLVMTTQKAGVDYVYQCPQLIFEHAECTLIAHTDTATSEASLAALCDELPEGHVKLRIVGGWERENEASYHNIYKVFHVLKNIDREIEITGADFWDKGDQFHALVYDGATRRLHASIPGIMQEDSMPDGIVYVRKGWDVHALQKAYDFRYSESRCPSWITNDEITLMHQYEGLSDLDVQHVVAKELNAHIPEEVWEDFKNIACLVESVISARDAYVAERTRLLAVAEEAIDAQGGSDRLKQKAAEILYDMPMYIGENAAEANAGLETFLRESLCVEARGFTRWLPGTNHVSLNNEGLARFQQPQQQWAERAVPEGTVSAQR